MAHYCRQATRFIGQIAFTITATIFAPKKFFDAFFCITTPIQKSSALIKADASNFVSYVMKSLNTETILCRFFEFSSSFSYDSSRLAILLFDALSFVALSFVS